MTFHSGVYGGVDMGTGSIRFSVAEINASGKVTERHRLVLRHMIGDDLATTGAIPQQKIDAVLRWYNTVQQTAQSYGVKKVGFIATEVLRSAQNGGDFIQQMATHHGVQVHMVNHESEIRLSADGNAHVLHHFPYSLYVDIGGGSSEVSLVNQQAQVLTFEGLKIGASRDLHLFETATPNPATLQQTYQSHVQAFRKAAETCLAPHGLKLADVQLVASGIPRFLTDISPDMAASFKTTGMFSCPLEQLTTYYTWLVNMGPNGRKTHPALSGDEGSRLKTPGFFITRALAEACGKTEFTGCSSGIEFGVIRALANKNTPAYFPVEPQKP